MGLTRIQRALRSINVLWVGIILLLMLFTVLFGLVVFQTVAAQKSDESLPKYGWYNCKSLGFGPVPGKSPAQRFKLCHQGGWTLFAYCLDNKKPPPPLGTVCERINADTFWCGDIYQPVKIYDLDETPTPQPTATHTSTVTATSTATATSTSTATATATSTSTPTNTATNTPTHTATSTSTSTPTNTVTPRSINTSTPTQTLTHTATPTTTHTPPPRETTPTATPRHTLPPTSTPTKRPKPGGGQMLAVQEGDEAGLGLLLLGMGGGFVLAIWLIWVNHKTR